MNRKLTIGLGLLASVALVTGVALAQGGAPTERGAQQGGPQQQGDFIAGPQNAPDMRGRLGALLHGRVAAKDGTTLVLNMPQPPRPGNINTERNPQGNRGNANPPNNPNEVRVATNAQTKFYVTGKASPTLADIAVGDNVAILLDRPAQGNTPRTLTALGVTVIPRPEHVLLMGEVSNKTASSFKLVDRSDREIATLAIVAGTKIIVPGEASGALQNGDRVAVRAKPTGERTGEAEIVLVNPGDRDNSLNGFVASVSGNTIVVWTRFGDSVNVNAVSAVFARPNESLTTIRVGDNIRAYGIWNADGTAMTAQLIGELNPGPGPGQPRPGGPGPIMPGPGPAQRQPNRQP